MISSIDRFPRTWRSSSLNLMKAEYFHETSILNKNFIEVKPDQTN